MARLARSWILVFCQVEAAMKWRAALGGGGRCGYKRTCQWIKPDGKPQYSGDRPGNGYESIVACHAPGRSRWNGGGSHGVFIVNKSGDPRTGHQTQKPLALMEKLVRLFSDRRELIVDPFAGSGTTGVAADSRRLSTHGIRERLHLGVHGSQLVPDDLLDAFDEGSCEVVCPGAHGGRRAIFPAPPVATATRIWRHSRPQSNFTSYESGAHAV